MDVRITKSDLSSLCRAVDDFYTYRVKGNSHKDDVGSFSHLAYDLVECINFLKRADPDADIVEVKCPSLSSYTTYSGDSEELVTEIIRQEFGNLPKLFVLEDRVYFSLETLGSAAAYVESNSPITKDTTPRQFLDRECFKRTEIRIPVEEAMRTFYIYHKVTTSITIVVVVEDEKVIYFAEIDDEDVSVYIPAEGIEADGIEVYVKYSNNRIHTSPALLSVYGTMIDIK